jgi:hypothetical protein
VTVKAAALATRSGRFVRVVAFAEVTAVAVRTASAFMVVPAF